MVYYLYEDFDDIALGIFWKHENSYKIFTLKFINEICIHVDEVKCNSYMGLYVKFLGFEPSTVLIILLCEVRVLSVLDQLPSILLCTLL